MAGMKAMLSASVVEKTWFYRPNGYKNLAAAS